MISRIFAVCVFITALVTVSPRAQTDRILFNRAEREIRHSRYADAESTLSLLSQSATGDLLDETLFLLAGLKSSAEDATRLYRRIIDDDPESEWARLSYLELSKIQYALGNYDESYLLLQDSRACDISEEACLFQGLSAIMLERYGNAKRPLSSINTGKLRTWAYLSLAEADLGLDKMEEACARYRALAQAEINPAASYRYAECLENDGDIDGASEQYNKILENFPDTPEAVRAEAKLRRITEPQRAVVAVDTTQSYSPPKVLSSGYTIQFGSFRDRENAIKLASRIKRVFPATRIDSGLLNYREYHRVRFGYFSTREEAQAQAEVISREMNEDYTIMTLP